MPTGDLPPPRIVLNAVEGFGKTTIGSQVPDAVLILAGGETGYLTLFGSGLVEAKPNLVTNTWTETLNAISKAKEYPALVLDALGGFQEQCVNYTIQNDFGGDRGSYLHYQRGWEYAASHWMRMLAGLRSFEGPVLLLSHARIKPFPDPLGETFNRYVVDLHEKLWAPINRWADAVLFGNFKSEVNKKSRKSTGGAQRIIYTEHRDAYDAKNRYTMSPSFSLPSETKGLWDIIYKEMTNG
jgi:hypothetical protein